MKSVIKIRLYPTKRQKQVILSQLDIHKDLYNLCLEERKKAYETDKTSITCYDQIKSKVPKLTGTSNASAMQQTVRRLDKAFGNFFRRIKNKENPGYPRFKQKLDSIDYCYGDGCKIRKNTLKGKVYFQYIGEIKAIVHREINLPSRCSLKYSNGDFYACFTVDAVIKTPVKTNKSVGLDFGLKTFLVTSDNQFIQNPKFHRQNQDKLSKLQSQRSQVKTKQDYQNKTCQIQKTWKGIINRRHDFNHKLANSLLSQYDTICLEKLSVQNLTSKIKNVNRTYRDVCWNQFTNILAYKAANAGKQLIFVNPTNTSRTCSNCGIIHDLTLQDRILTCSCGTTINRDYNAACNILRLGLQSLTGSVKN